ncbi:MAG: hypothetical protein LUF35_11175 [Lachnospiraceae bacterium]|nr:hypothetical protein [Lachnospiraceae bacterium]
MRKKWFLLIFLFFGYLLLFPQTALLSAQDGLLLWYRQVLPILFPFLFLNTLAMRTIHASDLPGLLIRPLMRAFHCSAYGAFVILSGFLCGFPMGAFLTGDLYRNEKISRDEARLLFGFVNNLSPGFIISYLSAGQMKMPRSAGWFLVQILGAALLCGWLDARTQSRVSSFSVGIESESEPDLKAGSGNIFSLIDDCIYAAMSNALRLGAYIMLFAILSGAVQKIFPVTCPAALLLVSGIEVTSGVRLIAESGLSASAKYVAVSALGAFGSLSALVQSAGIARMDKEMLFYYIKSRAKITLLAILISSAALLVRF